MDSGDGRIDDLLERWEDSLCQGSPLTPEQVCADCPELLEEVRSRIHALCWVDAALQAGAPGAGDGRPAQNGAVPSTMPQRREQLGRYRLDVLIGEGSFGQVWKGFDLELQRAVAVKVLRRERANWPGHVQRFREEARKIAQVRHQNIVAVHDVGDDAGCWFIVSDLIEGRSLNQVNQSEGLSLDQKVEIVAKVAEALEHVHRIGIVHRDIKPSNIVLDREQRPFVTDFGIAVQTDGLVSGGPDLVGTPAYMSPEQLRLAESTVDPRSDIYSLGVVLYELLTGRRPYSSGLFSEIRTEMEAGQIVSPRELNPQIPAKLDEICMKALARNPADRFASAGELADALENYLHPVLWWWYRRCIPFRQESSPSAGEMFMPDPNVPQILPLATRRFLKGTFIALPVAVITAFAVWSYMPRQYTATAILRLSPSDTALLFHPGDANNMGGSTFDIYKRTQRALIRSRFVIIPALRDQSLARVPVLADQLDPVEWLENNLSVAFPDESELMYVSLTAANPEGLDQLVNKVVQAYLEEFVFTEAVRKRERFSSLEIAVKNVEEQLKPKRADLKVKEEKFGPGGMTPLTPDQQKASQRLEEFQKQLARVQADLLQATSELQLREADAHAADDDIEITDQELRHLMRSDPKAKQLEADKQRIADHIDATRRALKPGAAAPNLARLERDLENLDKKIEARKQALRPELVELRRQAAAASIGGLNSKIALLKVHEKRLTDTLDAQPQSRRRQANDVEDLRRDIAQREKVQNQLQVELEQMRVELQAVAERGNLDSDSRLSSSRVKQWSRAQPARIANSKSRLAKTAAAAVVSLFLAVFLAGWLDTRKDRVEKDTRKDRDKKLSAFSR